jgi:hypothetical protein
MGADSVLDNINKYKIDIRDVKDPSCLSSTQIDEATAISFFPALALPLNNKDHAVCPATHMDYLRNTIPSIKKVIIIGWRAADPFLLETLKENLNPEAQIGVISGANAETTVVPNIKKYLENDVVVVENKYSESLTNDSLEDFILS